MLTFPGETNQSHQSKLDHESLVYSYRSRAGTVAFWGAVKTDFAVGFNGVEHRSATVVQTFVSISVVHAADTHPRSRSPTTISTLFMTRSASGF